MHPLLPLKNKRHISPQNPFGELGVLVPGDLTVYHGVIYLTDFNRCTKEEFATVDALLDAGWEVD